MTKLTNRYTDKQTKFYIEDWAGNICFNGIEFDSFEDAWGYIYEQFPDEEEFDDYYVFLKERD